MFSTALNLLPSEGFGENLRWSSVPRKGQALTAAAGCLCQGVASTVSNTFLSIHCSELNEGCSGDTADGTFYIVKY